MDCIFCKIIEGQIPAEPLYQDDHLIVLKDIAPQAPIHKLIIPKQHIPTLNELKPDHQALISQCVLTATKLAHELKIDEAGYRLVWNCNAEGGQAVYHIHLHLLGGRRMQWPPG